MMLEYLNELVEKAGQLTLRYFRKDIDIELKKDMSPVTIADRETECFLRAEIAKHFPNDRIIGEEMGVMGTGESDRIWIIDPIDGTKAFIAGVPIFGVQIAVKENGKIIAAAVGLPALKEKVVAERGKGCWWNEVRCHVSKTEKLSDAILLTTDILDIEDYGRKPAWDDLIRKVKFVRTWGDCYGHVLVATGRAEIMFDPIMAQWDCAPFPVILEEAGGHFYDFRGGQNIDENGFISVNAALSDEVMKIVHSMLGPTGSVLNE